MKILFKNRTKYTEKTYKKFIEFHSNKYNFRYNLFTMTIIFLFLFCIVLQIMYNYYLIAFLTAIIFTCFCLYRFFHPISLINKEFHGETIKNEKSFIFKFYEKYIKVCDKSEFSIIKYYQIHKVFETRDFFYIYIDKHHAYLLDKNEFLIGNEHDFSIFIKRKCFLRFKKTTN